MYVHWDLWNVDHVRKHGVRLDEAEDVLSAASPPYPEPIGEEKYSVWGPTMDGRMLQVIFIFRSVASIRLEDVPLHERDELTKLTEVPYIIHARDLTPREKRRLRRRRK